MGNGWAARKGMYIRWHPLPEAVVDAMQVEKVARAEEAFHTTHLGTG